MGRMRQRNKDRYRVLIRWLIRSVMTFYIIPFFLWIAEITSVFVYYNNNNNLPFLFLYLVCRLYFVCSRRYVSRAHVHVWPLIFCFERVSLCEYPHLSLTVGTRLGCELLAQSNSAFAISL